MWRTNLRVLLVAACVIGFYTLVAHAIPQLESEVPASLSLGAEATPEALASAGERIYNGARCGSRQPGKDCKTYLYESLTQPNAFVVSGFGPIMPDMRRQLADDQLWALVAY